MKRIFKRLYTFWAFFWMVFFFLVLYPPLWVIIQRKSWHWMYLYISRGWAWGFYTFSFLPVNAVWNFPFDRKGTYVFCPNHFSYLDIILLIRTTPQYLVFVGLHDLAKLPLFGYLYRHLHIPVNRASGKDRYRTYQNSKKTIAEQKSVVVFPEGGIWTKPIDMPYLSPFKDGPFKLAIETQVPLVPVTIVRNWKMMPLMDFKNFSWMPSEVIYHEAIDTTGMTLADTKQLKASVFEIIQKSLLDKNHLPPKTLY
jgi:1-acyl-sn-glycerol-3-phosphate acyltransferase